MIIKTIFTGWFAKTDKSYVILFSKLREMIQKMNCIFLILDLKPTARHNVKIAECKYKKTLATAWALIVFL